LRLHKKHTNSKGAIGIDHGKIQDNSIFTGFIALLIGLKKSQEQESDFVWSNKQECAN
jgi:hypothetical protein